MKQNASTNATVYSIVTVSVCTCTNQLFALLVRRLAHNYSEVSQHFTVAPIRIMPDECLRKLHICRAAAEHEFALVHGRPRPIQRA